MRVIAWTFAILIAMWITDTFPNFVAAIFLTAMLYGIYRAIRWAWSL